jgi:hypothetical protein
VNETKPKKKKKYLLDDEKARARTGAEEARKWVRRKGTLGSDAIHGIASRQDKTRVWRKGTSSHLIKRRRDHQRDAVGSPSDTYCLMRRTRKDIQEAIKQEHTLLRWAEPVERTTTEEGNPLRQRTWHTNFRALQGRPAVTPEGNEPTREDRRRFTVSRGRKSTKLTMLRLLRKRKRFERAQQGDEETLV